MCAKTANGRPVTQPGRCIWGRELSSATLNPRFPTGRPRWCCTAAEVSDRRWRATRCATWDTRALFLWMADGARIRARGCRWRSVQNCQNIFEIVKPCLELPNHGDAQIDNHRQHRKFNELQHPGEYFIHEFEAQDQRATHSRQAKPERHGAIDRFHVNDQENIVHDGHVALEPVLEPGVHHVQGHAGHQNGGYTGCVTHDFGLIGSTIARSANWRVAQTLLLTQPEVR